jgi:hypothetical protein
MSEIITIVDKFGNERRCGSLLPPKNFVSSFRTYEAEKPLYSDAEIRRIITDPNRIKARQFFGASWIMNQRNHGSCNGFAGAGALSKARRRRGINDNLLLSGAWLYSLINGNQDNGSALEDGLKAVEEHGIAPASLVTWDMIYQRQMPANAKAEAAKHKGLVCYAVKTKQGFRSALAADFPVIVAVMAGNRFQQLDSKGIAGVDRGSGNHAIHCDDICLVGGEEVYDTCNSWGSEYGQQGRGYSRWASFEQTFENHTFYAIGSTFEDE